MADGKVIVGLTGTFGSGKSTAAHLFEELGALVVSADSVAHEALWKDSDVYKQIVALFPEVPKDENGLDRKALAKIVFQDEARRKKLEAVIHPYVRVRMEEEIADAESSVVVLEIPLLFEADFGWLCDKTVVVSAPQDVIEKRLKEKGFEEQEIRARLAAQMPLKEKESRADYVVDNSKSLKEIKLQVEKLWREFRVKV
jgi:dephospho-CoA kinase